MGRAQSRSGTKNGTKNVGFCHAFFYHCPANRGGVFNSVLIMTKIRVWAVAGSCSQDGYKIITMSDFKIITGEKRKVCCDDLGF